MIQFDKGHLVVSTAFMGKFHQFHISITTDQYEKLRQTAFYLRIPMVQVLKRALEEYLAEPEESEAKYE